jgi:hypothetical protein
MLPLGLVYGVPLDAPFLAFLLAFVFGFLLNKKQQKEFTFGYLHPTTGERVGPQPKQALAHACSADVLFYGGAAGGGKSEFLIVEAVTTCLEFPGVEVAVFRRTHKELLKSLVGRFRKLVPKHVARFNKSDMCATFANGSVLWFCHCQHEDDVYNYQSAEWVLLGIDEASHFTQFQVDYLTTRVRSARKHVRRRVILTSNPGNVGHGWLKRRFLRVLPVELGKQRAPEPYQVWRPVPLPGDPTPPADVFTRCFIPAKFDDNPAFKEADPTYLARIWALGGDKARQLAEGDWDANESMVVGGEWREEHRVAEGDKTLRAMGLRVGQWIAWHVVQNDTWRPPAGALIYGSVDYGYGAPWSFHLHAVLPGGHTRTFFEHYMPRKRDAEQAQMIRAALERLMAPPNKGGCSMSKPEWIVMDPSMWNSRAEMGLSKSIAEVYEDELGRPLNVVLMKGAGGRGARVSRPQRWKAALATAPDGTPWWSVTTACPELIRTVPEVPWDEKDPEVEDDASENHAYEDTGRFFEARPHAPVLPPPDPYEDLDAISAAHHRAQDLRGKAKGERFNPGAFA